MKILKRNNGINRYDIIYEGKDIGYVTYSIFKTMFMMKISFKEKFKNNVKLRKKIQEAVKCAVNNDVKEMDVE